jgi:aryl-alcohol dehydrogenase-like predicted oxidoreductase
MLAVGTMFWGWFLGRFISLFWEKISNNLIGDTFLDSVLANGVADEAELKAMTNLLLENGVTQFDTAEGYGFGSSETRLGEALRQNGRSAQVKTNENKRVF